jgi:hypothetical protein
MQNATTNNKYTSEGNDGTATAASAADATVSRSTMFAEYMASASLTAAPPSSPVEARCAYSFMAAVIAIPKYGTKNNT